MRYEHYSKPVVTAANGSATVTIGPITGRLVSIGYVKTDFVDGVDFAVTTLQTLQNLWTQSNVNASVQVAPRQKTHDNAGAEALYAAGGTNVRDHYILVDDYIQIAVTNGGDTKTGRFDIVVVTRE